MTLCARCMTHHLSEEGLRCPHCDGTKPENIIPPHDPLPDHPPVVAKLCPDPEQPVVIQYSKIDLIREAHKFCQQNYEAHMRAEHFGALCLFIFDLFGD